MTPVGTPLLTTLCVFFFLLSFHFAYHGGNCRSPATVRDRLLEAEKENPPNKDKSSGWVINTIIQNQTQGYEDSERGNLDVGKTLNSAPIADLFPETTVVRRMRGLIPPGAARYLLRECCRNSFN